jgi:hypothetical protein
MRKIRRLFAAGAVAGAVVVGSAAAAPAAGVTQERYETGWFEANECNGAGVSLSGSYHVVEREVPGGVDYKVNGHLTGTDLQGNEYVSNLQEHGTNVDFNTELVGRSALLSKGSAPNRILIFTFGNGGAHWEIECTR